MIQRKETKSGNEKEGRTDREEKRADAEKKLGKKRSNGHPESETESYEEPEEKGPAKKFFFRVFLQVYC